MGPNLLQALYDSLNAGKAGVKAAFAPKLGGPDAESAFKSALAGGVGAAMVPFGALDEAATGAGQYMAEDVGRAGAAVERAGMPTLGKALGVGGAALGMIPVAGSFAVDPEAGAAKVAGRSVLEHLAAQNLPEAVMRKAESLQAMYGEDALAKIVKEYADKGVPLFSHDLPMDEASRMARAREMGIQQKEWLHGGARPFTEFSEAERGSGAGGRSSRLATWGSDDPLTARNYADMAALDAPIKRILERLGDAEKRAHKTGNWDEYESLIIQAEDLERQLKEVPERGQNVIPFRVAGKYSIVDAGGEIPQAFDGGLSALVNAAEKRGQAGVKIKNLDDTPGLTDQIANHIAVIRPENIRSRFAAFDPRMKDSRFLLALKAGAIPLAGLGAAASLEGQ